MYHTPLLAHMLQLPRAAPRRAATPGGLGAACGSRSLEILVYAQYLSVCPALVSRALATRGSSLCRASLASKWRTGRGRRNAE